MQSFTSLDVSAPEHSLQIIDWTCYYRTPLWQIYNVGMDILLRSSRLALASVAPGLTAIPRNHCLIDRGTSLLDEVTGQRRVMAWPNTPGTTFAEIIRNFIIKNKIRWVTHQAPHFDRMCPSYVLILHLLATLLIMCNLISLCCCLFEFK